MDSHPVWFHMINTYGYCLAAVVRQSIVIGKIEKEGEPILIKYFGYFIWWEICVWALKILVHY